MWDNRGKGLFEVVQLWPMVYMRSCEFTVTFGMTSINMFYYTKVMQELFLDGQFPDTKNTFRGMTTMQDFWRVSLDHWTAPICATSCPALVFMSCWQFVEGPLITGLHTDWESYYNGDNVTGEDLGYIYFENKMLGVPRMRQIKVSPTLSIYS